MHITVTRFPYESALGGEEYHTLELMQHMQRAGCSVSFVGLCPVLLAESKKRGFTVTAVSGLKMPVTPLQLLLFLVAWPWQLWQFFKYRHSFFPVKNTTLYCLSLTDKIVLTPIAHLKGVKVIWVEHQKIGDWLLKSPLRFFYKWFSAYATIVPISPFNNRLLVQSIGVSSQSLQHIIHGVDVPLFYKERTKSATCNIGYTGRLESCKGLDVLINAIALLLAENTSVTCTLVGAGEQKETLQLLIKKHLLEKIITIQSPLSRTDYVQFLQAADVYVLPSLDESETFGLSAAEAAIAGAQLVVTTVAGIAQLLPESVAERVIPNNEATLAQAIKTALTKAKNGNKQLQQVAVELFNKKRMLTEYEFLLMSS